MTTPIAKGQTRLKRALPIKTLFERGQVKKVDAMRVVFLRSASEEGTQVGFSVSKRNFKRAVDRNRIKRLMREAYRLQSVDNKMDKSIMMVVYQSHKLPNYAYIYDNLGKLLNQLP